MRVLIIEDDKNLVLTLRDELENEYIVDYSLTGEEGEELAIVNNYDVIILDITLPDKNGIEICKAIRKENIKTPILMLTGDAGVDKKVTALDVGADDYLTKPFDLSELKARIRALLRRQYDTSTNVISIDDLIIDISRKTVTRNNISIPLRRKEFNLLEYLAQNSGRVVTREMILDHVWDSSSESLHNIVDVHIKYLRDRVDRKFNKKLIKTVYGVGYKIEA